MSNIIYINPYHSIVENLNITSLFVEQNKVTTLFEESTAHSRIKWNDFIDELRKGDTAVLYSFDNAFRNYNDMMFFIKYCATMHIRIISVFDRLDTKDEMFPESGTRNTFDVVCRIFKKRDKSATYDVEYDLNNKGERSKRLKRYSIVINMYKAGWNIQDIMSRVGYSAKSNIYRILREYNVKLDQPLKSRKKKKNQ